MAIYRNVASQKIAVYAHDTSADAPKTGDAANITAQISLDGGATAATNDTNPTELDATDAPGIYLFDLTQAETNADLVILSAVSATSDISIEPVIIYTLPTWAASQVAQTADHASNITAILADTNELQTDDVPGLIAALENLSAAQVNAEVDTALADIHLDHLLAVADDDTPVDNSVMAKIASGGDWSDFDINVDSLAGIRNETTSLGTSLPEDLANAVWDEAKAGHVAAGSFGEEVQAHALTSEIVSAASVADAVWDEATADHADSGSTGEALTNAGNAGDPWSTALPGAYAAGTAGEIIGNFSSDLTGAIAGLASTSTVTVISTVAGATATVYLRSTWEAAFTLSGSPGLTDYEKLIFVVKASYSDTDAESILYVDNDTGLVYIAQTTPTGASYGSLTANSATQFTVYVDVAEVAAKLGDNFAGQHHWWLKGIETGSTPDEAVFIASGVWRIERAWIRQAT